MATCDELATQLSGLQSQLATLQAKIDDPEGTCTAAGVTGDACTLYLKSLGRQAGSVQIQITGVQQQQQAQGCLGPPAVTLSLLDALAMSPSADTRLELFGTSERDLALWHMYQTTPGGGWTEWYSHGRPPGAPVPLSLASSTPALIHSDARIYLFIVAIDFSSLNGKLVGISQVQPSGGWTDWVEYGAPPSMLPSGGVPAVGLSDRPDTLSYIQVFVSGNDGNLYRLSQTVAGQDVWSDWISHGQPPSSQVFSTPVLASSADGRLELFIVGSGDGNLYHIWETTRGGAWSDWYSHGRPPSTTLIGPPTIAPSADGRLELFIVGQDGNLYHIWQTTPSGGWSDWFSHGGNPPGVFLSPVLFANADKRLELFVIGKDVNTSRLTLYNLHQTSPSDGWSDVRLFGKPSSATDLGGTMALNRDFDGRLELFVWGDGQPSDTVYHIYQKTPNGDWSDWFATYGSS